MFRHVVMFKWADGVDADHVAAVAAGLDNLAATIEQIKQYRHGPDVGLSDQNFDYVVVGDFDSSDDYVVYRDDPVHKDFIAELIAGRVTERAAVQYEID
ncbi:MAG: Dabb family protein [Acidimicrobiia bacterium]|nr:Dabb family protein [Acidimicrobiia bacterium]